MQHRRAAVPVAAVLTLLAAVVLSGCGAERTKINPVPAGEYVALGDSYSAAPGVPSPQGDDSGCMRSTNNYPSLIARKLKIDSFVDRTCGGAQTKDMTGSQRAGIAPQLDSLNTGTKLVTLGIGGNDFKIAATLMVTCPQLRASNPTGAPCSDAAASAGQNTLPEVQAALTKRISDVLKKIHQKAPHARVILVGYPQSYPKSGSCALLPLATGDYLFAYRLIELVNSAVQAAANQDNDTFIDIWAASAGHDMCSADPWVNGATYDGAAPYHPRAAEQQAVAKLIEAAIGNHFPPQQPSTHA